MKIKDIRVWGTVHEGRVLRSIGSGGRAQAWMRRGPLSTSRRREDRRRRTCADICGTPRGVARPPAWLRRRCALKSAWAEGGSSTVASSEWPFQLKSGDPEMKQARLPRPRPSSCHRRRLRAVACARCPGDTRRRHLHRRPIVTRRRVPATGTAIAVRAGRIVAVGYRDEVMKLKGSKTGSWTWAAGRLVPASSTRTATSSTRASRRSRPTCCRAGRHR